MNYAKNPKAATYCGVGYEPKIGRTVVLFYPRPPVEEDYRGDGDPVIQTEQETFDE